MFDKKKINFWRLAVIFMGFTVITLFFLWITPHEPKASMMTASMGNMAKNMHLNNLTIYDLFGESNMSGDSQDNIQNNNTGNSIINAAGTSIQNGTADNHHVETSGLLNTSTMTTVIVFGLTPLIIGGTIILTIVWIK